MIPEHQNYINQLPRELTEILNNLSKARLNITTGHYDEAKDITIATYTSVFRLFRSFPVKLLTKPPG